MNQSKIDIGRLCVSKEHGLAPLELFMTIVEYDPERKRPEVKSLA